MPRVVHPVPIHQVIGRQIILDDCEICSEPGGPGPIHDLQVTRKIGAGTYGTVFLAHDRLHPERQYAVKAFYIPYDDNYDDTSFPLADEAVAHAGATQAHENVVRFHGVINEWDTPYFFLVQDYHSGGDLQHALVDHSRNFYRKEYLLTSLALQLAEALLACHEASIFHRDIKPDNVLLSEDQTRIYLNDFGISTSNTKSCSWNQQYSSYMSPESSGVYGTTNYNNRHSDIYSLGILLVQLVTGHTPWDTPTASDQYYTYFLYHPDTFFTEVFPLSQQAAALLAGCLHPRPHRRISLSMLIAQLRSLERWYMTDDELAQAHPTLRRFDDVRRVRARVVGDGMLLTPPESPVLTQDRTLMDIAEEVAAFAIADSDESDDEEEPESTSRYPTSEVRSE